VPLREPERKPLKSAVQRLATTLAILLAATASPAWGEEDLVVGALLPYSGASSPSGVNIERSLIFASEEINAAGGIGGRRVRLAFRDTGPGPKHALAEAEKLVRDQGAVALLGPEDYATMNELLPFVAAREVPLVSGSTTLPPFEAFAGRGYFLSVAPGAWASANALAVLLQKEQVQRVAVVYTSDQYGVSFLSSLAGRLREDAKLPGAAVPPISATYLLEPEKPLSAFDPSAVAEADALILVASPKIGASFAREWGPSLQNKKWYLAPILESAEFVRNLPVGLGLTMRGVAPALPEDSGWFARKYRARWEGEAPLPEAHYYYDALVLLSLAMESIALEHGSVRTSLVRSRMEALSYASGGSGRWVGWYEVGRAFDLVRSGRRINYRGASGTLDVVDGVLSPGLSRVWQVTETGFAEQGLFFHDPCAGVGVCYFR